MGNEKHENTKGDADKAAKRDLRYGNAFGTQRDRSKPEEGGYLEPEFGDESIPLPDRSDGSEQEEDDTKG